MLQAFNICIDQGLFLFVAPTLELPLAGNSRSFRVEDVGINQIDWTMLERVCSATAGVVGLHTLIQIRADPT